MAPRSSEKTWDRYAYAVFDTCVAKLPKRSNACTETRKGVPVVVVLGGDVAMTSLCGVDAFTVKSSLVATSSIEAIEALAVSATPLATCATETDRKVTTPFTDVFVVQSNVPHGHDRSVSEDSVTVLVESVTTLLAESTRSTDSGLRKGAKTVVPLGFELQTTFEMTLTENTPVDEAADPSLVKDKLTSTLGTEAFLTTTARS